MCKCSAGGHAEAVNSLVLFEGRVQVWVGCIPRHLKALPTDCEPSVLCSAILHQARAVSGCQLNSDTQHVHAQHCERHRVLCSLADRCGAKADALLSSKALHPPACHCHSGIALMTLYWQVCVVGCSLAPCSRTHSAHWPFRPLSHLSVGSAVHAKLLRSRSQTRARVQVPRRQPSRSGACTAAMPRRGPVCDTRRPCARSRTSGRPSHAGTPASCAPCRPLRWCPPALAQRRSATLAVLPRGLPSRQARVTASSWRRLGRGRRPRLRRSPHSARARLRARPPPRRPGRRRRRPARPSAARARRPGRRSRGPGGGRRAPAGQAGGRGGRARPPRRHRHGHQHDAQHLRRGGAASRGMPGWQRACTTATQACSSGAVPSGPPAQPRRALPGATVPSDSAQARDPEALPSSMRGAAPGASPRRAAAGAPRGAGRAPWAPWARAQLARATPRWRAPGWRVLRPDGARQDAAQEVDA